MFLRRVFGRTLFAAAKSESSAAGAATAFRGQHNPLEEFFEVDRNVEDETPVVYGKNELGVFFTTWQIGEGKISYC